MRLLLSIFIALAASLIAISAAHAGFSTVIVDPGHGGYDLGGIPGQRVKEKIIALDIGRRVASALRADGLHVIMTRDRDVFVSLPARCAIANRHPRRTVFVSIHTNSAHREGAYGIETYYDSGSTSARLAARIERGVLDATHSFNRGTRRAHFYVLRKTRIPAVLVECGFLTNRAEAHRTLDPRYRQRIANAIAHAIYIESRR